MNTKLVTLGLSLLGIGGTALTSWLSVKGHEKAKNKETKKEKIRCYIPAAVAFAGTSGCILGSHHISRKEIAALTASATYLAANSEKIEKRFKQIVGEEKFIEAKKEVVQELKQEQKEPVIIEDTGYGKTLFVDYFGRQFFCSLEQVEWAEKMMNKLFSEGKAIVNMNTFYDLVGLKKDRKGWMYGWCDDLFEDAFGYSVDKPICFENILGCDENGRPFYIIDIKVNPPIKDYLDA